MKVAYLVGNYPEPSEQFIAREIAALGELGAQVTVYSIAGESGFACPWCVLGRHIWLSVLPKTWRGVSRFPFGELARLRAKPWKEFAGGLDLAARCAADMRAKGMEHVHAHFATKPAAVGLMAAAMLRVPFTLSAHARDVFVDGSALPTKVAAAEHVAVCSRASLDALRAVLPARLHDRLVLIRHGVDLSGLPFCEEKPPHSPARILAAGRMVEKKGFEHLIEAMGRLDDCVCELAGTGPLEPVLRERAARLGDRVVFDGWVSQGELRARMAEADVLAVPSVVARDGDRDGVPNVLLEAASVGLPVVACDAGGIGEFVVDGETGRLVPPRDARAIAAGIHAALSDLVATRRLARGARKKVEIEYNLRENARLLMNFFTRPGRERA